MLLDSDELKANNGSVISDEAYADLIREGVRCSDCNDKLCVAEILMHKHVGITETKDMSCQACWMKAAYSPDNLG
jgi:hypothetical protein